MLLLIIGLIGVPQKGPTLFNHGFKVNQAKYIKITAQRAKKPCE